jgi:Leucine-rich repeat (LRR) protein/GTPase SAR1 family protein
LPIRIYALAKELQIDNKQTVEYCTFLGILGKGSALASLTDEEARRVTSFIKGLRANSNDALASLLPNPPQKLVLRGISLTRFPDCLCELTNLRILDLSENQLTTIPETVGQLRDLRELFLYGNQLTALPESLGQLTWLRTLDLGSNQLTALPESLGRLANLQSLYLSSNQLKVLPEWLGRLSQLRALEIGPNRIVDLPDTLQNLKLLTRLLIWGNQLRRFPAWIGKITSLRILGVPNTGITELPDTLGALVNLVELHLGESPGGNPLKEFPEVLRNLKGLSSLDLRSCGLDSIPDWVHELTGLRFIGLANNRISDLPSSVAKLDRLEKINLDQNPMNPELAEAYRGGVVAIKGYLREMAKGARKRYEAKLLILGDGNEGKTCVSRALRGLRFQEQQTTHGVDVEQWKFPHPDDVASRGKDITLNIWDFEGQEISHQTHQFFLTSQSLYLLVFKCRDQFLMERAEYWLDTIRARAPKTKVAIVITQCENRAPYVPLDRIQSQYGDLLAEKWFFAVGCENGLNVKQLQTFLKRCAADLEFMGSPWPESYSKAEARIKANADAGNTHITLDALYTLFSQAGVSNDNFEDAAAAMSRLGVITHFPNSRDLQNFVVLRPQWLTKAISQVMEDAKLSEDMGEITLDRMEGLWNNPAYRGMFATFHNCMKEFELCYDLEDASQSCLVPLRFGYIQPAIPWSTGEDMKERRVEYKLNIRPPIGIMSRFIVKTHHMIVTTPDHPKGIYWHNGVFLRTGEGPLRSEALCRFIPEERRLSIEVRAAFPQSLSEQIHAYIKAVFSFFDGLEAERSYGCIKVDPETQAENRCSGLHTEKRIYSAISRQRVLDCEFEDHDVDPQRLVAGFSSFNEFVMGKVISLRQLRQELDKRPTWVGPFLRGAETLLDWVDINGEKLDRLLQGQYALAADFKQEAELKLSEYLACMSQMLDDRDYTAAPGLISIITKDRSPWNPVTYFKQTYVLIPYCECEGKIHACEDGKVEFTKDRVWWERSAPWVAQGTKFLAAGLQLAFAGMPLALGPKVADAIKEEVKLMEELTKHLELKAPEKRELAEADQVVRGDVGKDLRGHDQEKALTRAALARLLEETSPNNYRARRWGSLERIWMPDNSHRWLCEECAKHRR